MTSSHPSQAAVTFELLDGYKVEKFISKGSYGEVYQALRQPTANDASPFSSPASNAFGATPSHQSPPRGSNSTPGTNPLHRNGSSFDHGAASGEQQYLHPHMHQHLRHGSSASAAAEPGGAGLMYGANSRAMMVPGGDASGDDGAFGAARPSQRANTQNPRAMISGNSSLGSPLGLGLSGSRPPPLTHAHPQKVAIKVVRDYARRGTNVQGSDRYISRYTKKIAREVQLLQYFNGCREFVPVMDMYLSANKHDLYIVMKMYDYSLYTFIRREVAAKKLEEEEMRSPKKVRPEGSPRAQQLQPPQQAPPAPVRKGLRRIMTEAKTRVLTAQLLSGLAKMASVGSAHRDLSSGNVLYDPNSNRAAICDFGLSRANMNSDLAQTTNVVTAPYRSPELLLLVNKYDGQKVDVWSVGILMMEMLIGCPPVFEQNDNLQREGVFRNLCYCDMEYWVRQGAPTSLLENERGRKFDHYNKYPKFIERLENEKVLSPPGIDVLKSCLEQKPEDRKSCVELLQMPWFTSDPECMRLLDELSLHSDQDKSFQRRTLPNIEDGFGREDHIRFIESVVKKSATMRQHFTTK